MIELPAVPLWTAARPFRISPEAVASARNFTAEFLSHKVRLDADHIGDVVLVVSELVTNAIKYGAGGQRNIYLDVEVWTKWTLITVDDRDPQIHETASSQCDEGPAESGRGLLIVQALAERFWWQPRLLSKTANAAVVRTGMTLTDQDYAVLDGLEKPDE